MRSLDHVRCDYCGVLEDIHLLDGVLGKDGNDTGRLACIACYPGDKFLNEGWCVNSVEHVKLSIAPKLKPLYNRYLNAIRD